MMESISWKHSVPSTMSWFQGQNPFTNYQSLFDSSRKGIATKRKSSYIDDSPQPSKQYVSEEAMAAHMNQLHIGNNYFLSPVEVAEASDIHTGTTKLETRNFDARLENDFGNTPLSTEFDPSKSQLVLAPELASLQAEPILPKCILDQLRKPSMELVLWKPPVGLVDSLIRSALGDDPKDKDKKGKAEIDKSLNERISSYCDKEESTMHKPFQLYRVVPAMTPQEIENYEEEMSIM